MIGRRMTQREQWLIGGTVLFIALVALWLGVIEPYRNASALVERQIASRQRQLREVQEVARRYQSLRRQVAAAEARLAKGAQQSLFSFIETLTQRYGIRENLVSLRPQKAQSQGALREESVEIKLERISLEQLVKLLFDLEQGDLALQVRTLRVKTRFDNRSELDVAILVARYVKES